LAASIGGFLCLKGHERDHPPLNLFLPFLLVFEGVIFGFFKQTRRHGLIDLERVEVPGFEKGFSDGFLPSFLE
jgi:hypothetical protein